MSRQTYAVLALVACCTVLVGCSARTSSRPADTITRSGQSSSDSLPGTSPSPSRSAATPVTTPEPKACGPGARAFFLNGPHGLRLAANAYGSGPDAAVFLHQVGPTGMCGFWPYAHWLATQHHVLVVLVARCDYDSSTCPAEQRGDQGVVNLTAPAVEWARAHGATRVTLVGGSSGASDALQAGGVVAHVNAVVALSPDGADTGADDLASAQRLHVPTLFVVAPADGYCPLPAVRPLYDAVPARQKRFEVPSQGELFMAHGWELLQDHYPSGAFSPVATLVASWVTGRVS